MEMLVGLTLLYLLSIPLSTRVFRRLQRETMAETTTDVELDEVAP